MIARRWLVTLGILASQFAGCAATPPVEIEEWQIASSRHAFMAQREEVARQHESSGALRLALQDWSAIGAVAPEDPQPRAQIERLQKAITAKVAKHRRAAATARSRGDYAGAKQHYLKILALQPDNRDAIARLRKLEVNAGYGRLASAPKISDAPVQAYELPQKSAAKTATGVAAESERPVQITVVQPPPSAAKTGDGKAENLKLARRYLSEKNYDAALVHFLRAQKNQEGPEKEVERQIVRVRSVLAEQHYDRGVSAFRAANYDRAVTEFKKALEYDPQHQKARLYLSSASEMQSRLKR